MNIRSLLVINDGKVYKCHESYFIKDTFPLFIKELLKYIDKITMCVPIIDIPIESCSGLGKLQDVSSPSGVSIVDSFAYNTFFGYFMKFPSIIKQIPVFIALIRGNDAIFMRSNSLNIFVVFVLSRLLRKPTIMYVVGDVEQVAVEGTKYKGALRYLVRILGMMHTTCMRYIVAKSEISFFVGKALMEKYGSFENNYTSYTSIVKADDIIESVSCDIMKRRIIYVGRLSHEKGLTYLIKAVRLLLDSGIKISLSIVGDGPEKDTLVELCKNEGIFDQCTFHGHIPYGKEMREIYAESGVFVLPSTSEGVGKVLVEAMSQGIPVIASDVGGLPDIVTDKDNGVLVPPRDSQAIAEAVELVMTDKSFRQKVVDNGLAFAREHTLESRAMYVAEKILDKSSGELI